MHQCMEYTDTEILCPQMDLKLKFYYKIIYFLDLKKFGPSQICPQMPPKVILSVNKCCGFAEKKFALEKLNIHLGAKNRVFTTFLKNYKLVPKFKLWIAAK